MEIFTLANTEPAKENLFFFFCFSFFKATHVNCTSGKKVKKKKPKNVGQVKANLVQRQKKKKKKKKKKPRNCFKMLVLF